MGWIFECIICFSLVICLLILITNNRTYLKRFDSLDITSLIGDSFTKIYTVFIEFLNVASQPKYGTVYYEGSNRQYMGLIVDNLMNESFSQTIREISKFNSQESYGNEASEQFELLKFSYILNQGRSGLYHKTWARQQWASSRP